MNSHPVERFSFSSFLMQNLKGLDELLPTGRCLLPFSTEHAEISCGWSYLGKFRSLREHHSAK
jgi:hypothetical protein